MFQSEIGIWIAGLEVFFDLLPRGLPHVVGYEMVEGTFVGLLDLLPSIVDTLRNHLLGIGSPAQQPLLQFLEARNIKPDIVGL